MVWLEDSSSLDLQMLRAAYRSGQLTPTRVVEAVYDRIVARGDDRVWIHLVPREQALRRAADLERGNDRNAPLYGVPFAVKDNFDVPGLARAMIAYLMGASSPTHPARNQREYELQGHLVMRRSTGRCPG